MDSKALAYAILISLTLAACGGTTGTGTTEPDGEPGEVLLRIEWSGGFAPIEWLLGGGPAYTLTRDGRLISEGPVLAIFPGPLLPFYVVTEVSEGEMRQIESMIDRMGLPDMVDEVDDTNTSFVADATTEVITYLDSNGAHRYSVHALGLGMGGEPSATRVFEELRTALDTISLNRESTPFQPERVRVIAGEGFVDSDFTDLRDWPLPDTTVDTWLDLDNGWRCRAFDASVLERFDDATQVTTWRSPTPGSGPGELKLLVRGLHPGEEDCPGSLS